MNAAFTIAAGQVVRLDRTPHRVVTIHCDDTVTVVGPHGMRTVDSFRLTPGRKGDVVVTLSQPPTTRRGR